MCSLAASVSPRLPPSSKHVSTDRRIIMSGDFWNAIPQLDRDSRAMASCSPCARGGQLRRLEIRWCNSATVRSSSVVRSASLTAFFTAASMMFRRAAKSAYVPRLSLPAQVSRSGGPPTKDLETLDYWFWGSFTSFPRCPALSV